MTELTIRHATPDDWPIIAEMGARTFPFKPASEERHQIALQGWLKQVDDPSFRYENSWLSTINGDIIAHIRFIERVLCYGNAELSFGGVAAVMTWPEYRGHGYAYTLMRVVIDQMAQRGHLLSFLNGIPRFYDRLGYTTLWHRYATRFQSSESQLVTDDESGYRVREMTNDDIPAILALHNDEWNARPWRLKRSEDWLRFKLNLPLRATYVVEDTSGTLQGYSAGIAPEDRQEVGVANQPATVALLRHTANLLADRPEQPVSWLELPDSRATRFARNLCSIELSTQIPHRGGWMGRFIHSQPALDALQPELIARLAALEIPQAENAVFEAQADTVNIQAHNLTINVPQSIFLQLIFGFLPPNSIDEFLGTRVNEAGRNLLKRLFPPVVNGLAGLDWF